MFIACIIQAQPRASFHLSDNGLIPKIGEESERTVSVMTSAVLTNFIAGQESVTNWTSGVDSKFRSRILVWDPTNDYAKVRVVIGNCIVWNRSRTNHLADPGTELEGVRIAGQWFFHATFGKLSIEGSKYLGRFFDIQHVQGSNSWGFFKLNQPRYIGERWEMPLSEEAIMAKLDGLNLGHNSEMLEFAKSLNDNVKMSIQFVGMTNSFGINSFLLHESFMLEGHLRSANSSMRFSADIVLPFDPAPHFYVMKISTQGELWSGEEANKSYHGRGIMSSEVNVMCRPISQTD
ncbi:MAG TPA: hypothetical protein VHC44_17785 [Verrucomicrobiae bacterium]|nr:hypothetical protein [Verrucomicrobiae bacterium]